MCDPDRLNPYLSEMGVSYDLSSLVYSYLVIADNRGRLIGDLASTVPSLANGGISRDGRTYVYRLRQNVLWQDGVPFTARDVVASWEAVMNPRNNTFEREGYDRVASIEAAGPTTVMVRLRKRYPPFISRFFTPLKRVQNRSCPHMFSNANTTLTPGSWPITRSAQGRSVSFMGTRRSDRPKAVRPLFKKAPEARANRNAFHSSRRPLPSWRRTRSI